MSIEQPVRFAHLSPLFISISLCILFLTSEMKAKSATAQCSLSASLRQMDVKVLH